MKINKRVLFILMGLVLVFGLMGCSADNTNKDDANKNVVEEPQDEVKDEDVDVIDDPVEEHADDIAINPIDGMIESSDYISKIKLISKGSSNEIKILDNIKGNLSDNDLPALENLELNRVYVVFLEDIDNGVVLTDDENGVILLEGDNDELFEKINKSLNNN